MNTKVINIKEYRNNLTKIWKESKKNKQRLIVVNHSTPVFEVKPLYQDYVEFETDEWNSKEIYQLADKSFSFWKNDKDDNIFNEKIEI